MAHLLMPGYVYPKHYRVLIHKVNSSYFALDEFLLSQQPNEQESIIMGFHPSYVPHYFLLLTIRINVEDVT